jgi:hypothetical protein
MATGMPSVTSKLARHERKFISYPLCAQGFVLRRLLAG